MKNLLQFPRDISAKYCLLKSGPSENFKNDELPITPLESKKITEIPVSTETTKQAEINANNVDNKKLEQEELALNKETIKNLFEENNIPGLTDEINHLKNDPNNEPAVKDFDFKEFNFEEALQETNSLLANLSEEVSHRGFGGDPENYYSA